jgi:hypothetical protein
MEASASTRTDRDVIKNVAVAYLAMNDRNKSDKHRLQPCRSSWQNQPPMSLRSSLRVDLQTEMKVKVFTVNKLPAAEGCETHLQHHMGLTAVQRDAGNLLRFFAPYDAVCFIFDHAVLTEQTVYAVWSCLSIGLVLHSSCPPNTGEPVRHRGQRDCQLFSIVV